MSEDSMSDGQAKRGLLEQHAQSVLLAVITAALIYSGSFVVQAREDAVRMSAQLTTLTAEVAGLRVQLATLQGNYIGRDDFRDHETRIRALEARTK